MIKSWLGNRRRAKTLARYNAGFDYGAGQCLRGIPPHELRDRFDGDTLDVFEQGLQAAITCYERRIYAR